MNLNAASPVDGRRSGKSYVFPTRKPGTAYHTYATIYVPPVVASRFSVDVKKVYTSGEGDIQRER
jgi:hypothetical protein